MPHDMFGPAMASGAAVYEEGAVHTSMTMITYPTNNRR
jgi:hypothetical protein